MWTATQAFLNQEHQEIFEQTKEIPGWQLPGDSFRLYEMAYRAGDIILEIGTFGGRSAVVELRGALANPERQIQPQFFGIDVDFNGIWRTANTLNQAGLSSYALLFHGDLEQFTQAFTIQPTMVFVDGDHRYSGVKRDLEILARLLAPNVPVLCHDYSNPENDTGEMGVRQAVDEFVQAGYARFAGVSGCSAFLITSERCQGKSGNRLTPAEFANHRAMLYENYMRDLFVQGQQTQAQPPIQVQPIEVAESNQALKQKLGNARIKLKQCKAELSQLRAELSSAQDRIEAMQSSKFWRMRSLWFKFRHFLGFVE